MPDDLDDAGMDAFSEPPPSQDEEEIDLPSTFSRSQPGALQSDADGLEPSSVSAGHVEPDSTLASPAQSSTRPGRRRKGRGKGKGLRAPPRLNRMADKFLRSIRQQNEREKAAILAYDRNDTARLISLCNQ